jgi:hypothetical protein
MENIGLKTNAERRKFNKTARFRDARINGSVNLTILGKTSVTDVHVEINFAVK